MNAPGPLSVLHVSASGNLGGAERVLLDHMRWQQHHDPATVPSLLTLEAGPLLDAARDAGVAAWCLPLPPGLAHLGESGSSRIYLAGDLCRAIPGAWRFVGKLRQEVTRLSPQLIHSHSLKTHVLLALAEVPGSALLWHIHDYVSARHTSRLLLRRLSRRCHVAVANSQSVADDFHAAMPRVPIITVLNGVDIDTLQSGTSAVSLDALSGLPPASPDTVRVGLIATFARWKGHEVFLQALADLLQFPVRGYVIGAPVYRTLGSQFSFEELKRAATSLRLDARVGFPGFVDDRAACLRSLDIVVHASTAPEPFGLVVAEAMAAGRALITSGIGGAGELVRPGIDALTHRPGDAKSLADAIRRLIEDPALRGRLGGAARQVAVQRFSMTRFANEMSGAYAHAVELTQVA